MSGPHGICLDFRPSNGLHIAGPAVQGACTSRRRGVWDNLTQRPCLRRQVSHLTSTAHHNIHRYILLSTIMGQSRLDIHTMEALGCRHTRRATSPRVNLNCGRRPTHKKKHPLPSPPSSSKFFRLYFVRQCYGMAVYSRICLSVNKPTHILSSPLILTYALSHGVPPSSRLISLAVYGSP